jgi:GAF domain-containing protein
VRPISQAVEAAEEPKRSPRHGDMLADLRMVGDQVTQAVSVGVRLSLAWSEHRVTYTLVASDDEVAVLDGVQYLDGGPCVDAVNQARGIETTAPELMEEDPWRMFAQAASALGVGSTLTMPLTDHGRVLGSVNLYADSDHAFQGHHEELAEILGAWAPGALRQTDESFTARRLAQEPPRSLRAEGLVSRAVGMLAVRLGIDVTAADERLSEAAARAGITPHQLAEVLIRLA